MVESTNVYLTEHAYLRMKQRLGLNRNAANKLAKRALEKGLIGGCVKGRLSTYLFARSEDAAENSIRLLYGEHIFVFVYGCNEARLLTVFQLDNDYRAQAISAQKKVRMRSQTTDMIYDTQYVR